jgi:23S rRNA pseudouridine1911/1915/1917 synthase
LHGSSIACFAKESIRKKVAELSVSGMLSAMEQAIPIILKESQDYLVVFKPAGIPTVPLNAGSFTGDTLLELVGQDFPEIVSIRGLRPWEGGVVHRLDTATSGLVLIARTDFALKSLQASQAEGLFQKKYLAGSFGGIVLDGFPKPAPLKDGGQLPVLLSSRFRPYGLGRKAVRPLDDQSSRVLLAKSGAQVYHTLVRDAGVHASGERLFLCELTAGFRHQVRCHLAWCGFPLAGDSLYGGADAQNLHLFALSLRFSDPKSKVMVNFEVPWRPAWAKPVASGQIT